MDGGATQLNEPGEGNTDSEEATGVEDGGKVTRLDKPGRECMDPERGSGGYGGLWASRLNKPREGRLRLECPSSASVQVCRVRRRPRLLVLVLSSHTAEDRDRNIASA